MPGKRIRAGITAFLASTMAVAVAGASSAAEPQAGATSAAPAKAWADPGTLERAKTPSTQADAGPASPANNGKDAAPSASAQPQPAAKVEPVAAKAQHETPVVAASAPNASEVKHAKVRKASHANPPRKATARKPVASHVAIGDLPNKKDDYAAPAAEPEFDPFTGYRQPVSAAY